MSNDEVYSIYNIVAFVIHRVTLESIQLSGYLTHNRETNAVIHSGDHTIALYDMIIETDDNYFICPMCLVHEQEKMMMNTNPKANRNPNPKY